MLHPLVGRSNHRQNERVACFSGAPCGATQKSGDAPWLTQPRLPGFVVCWYGQPKIQPFFFLSILVRMGLNEVETFFLALQPDLVENHPSSAPLSAELMGALPVIQGEGKSNRRWPFESNAPSLHPAPGETRRYPLLLRLLLIFMFFWLFIESSAFAFVCCS